MFKKVLIKTAFVLGVLLLCAGAFAGWFFYQMRDMRPLETAKLSDSIFVVKSGICNAYLVKTAEGYIAFDAGADPAETKKGCGALSIDPASVTAVFLTHSDADHVDGLTAFPSAKVYISKDEVPLLKEKKYRHFLGLTHMNKLPVSQYSTLTDGDFVTVGGVTVNSVATPGHTLGSMSYRAGDSLFTGDLCLVVNGEVRPMLKIFTEDMGTDAASIRKIAGISGIKRIYTAHTGFTDDIDMALKKWR